MTSTDATGQNRTPKHAPHVAAWWVPFCTALAESGNVSHACKTVLIARSTAYEAREAHADFAAAWDEALEFAADALEFEIRRRAMQGVDEPIFYKGQEVGTIRRYSDGLLMFLAKATRPEKFRERLQVKNDVNLTASDALVAAFGDAVAKIYGDNTPEAQP